MKRQPACGFCDGSGLWVDPEAGPGGTDPCPLCEGTGLAPVGAAPAPGGPAGEDLLGRAIATLPSLSQPERQRLYELLHRRYDCRIYR